MRSRWFPLVFAIVHTARYFAFLAYDYWTAEKIERNFHALEFIQRDLARPWFEPTGFCGAWVHYLTGQSACIGFDYPALLAAALVYSAAGQADCLDALTTPRGQITCALFVPACWYLVGLSARRFAQRRYRPAAKDPILTRCPGARLAGGPSSRATRNLRDRHHQCRQPRLVVTSARP